MKRLKLKAASIITLLFATMLITAVIASGEEEKLSFSGKIMSFDPSTNIVVITNTKSDETMTFKLEDQGAIESLKEGKIKIGNKAKIKYIKKGDKDVAVSFKKTERC